MLNDIMDAVTRRLDELFGEGYEIYADVVKQGLKEPCFFVQLLEPSEKQVTGQRYYRKTGLCIQYFPRSTKEILRELNLVNDILMDGMEHITLADGSLLRGTGMSARPDMEQRVLSFFVSYNMFLLKPKEQEDTMDDIVVKGVSG